MKISRSLASLLLAASCACAAHTGGEAATPRGYAPLLDKVCQPERAEGQVELLIRDPVNKPIPGVHVQLVQADAAAEVAPSVVHATTDADGRASLAGQGDRYYTLLAGPLGFAPQAKVFFLPAGCTGRMEMRLRVLEVEGLS